MKSGEIYNMIISSFFKDSPININQIIESHIGSFDKSRLNILINATDDKNNTSKKEVEIKLYSIANLIKNPDKLEFSWDFINYSSSNIEMELEIIDEKRNILIQSDKIIKSYENNPINIITELKSKYINKDNLFYRIKLVCLKDNWEEYYPTRYGVLFNYKFNINNLKSKTIYGNIRNDYDFLMNYLNKGIELDQSILEKMINLLTNPIDNKTFFINDNNKERYLVETPFTNYAEENNFGIHDNKLKFPIDELKNFVSNKYELNSYINGKKVFYTDLHQQEKYDGIGISYLKNNDIKNNSTIELESNQNSLINEEKISCKYLLQTNEDVKNLYNDGIIIKTGILGKFHIPKDFSIYVKFRNSNFWKRVNPVRTKIKVNYFNDKKYSITVIIKDNYIPVIGNEIMLVSNNLTNKMYFKVNQFNNFCEYYQVPCYFVPVSHINEDGEIVTEFMDDIENTEIYVNGYRLIPNKDFTLLNLSLHNQVPSLILFKDMIKFGSKIEIIYLDELKNTYYFCNQLDTREDNRAIITLDKEYPPFIKGTFSVFANNKKLDSTKYLIANSHTIVFNNTDTRKNFMIKFHYKDNEKINYLLNLYNNITTYQDEQTELLGFNNYINKFITDNNIQSVLDTDKDSYLGIKFIYQLDTYYNYLKEMFNKIINNMECNLDCNNKDLFLTIKEKLISIDFTKLLPLYFNHDLFLNCNRSYNEKRFEDNISIFNPSRIYLLYQEADKNFKNNQDFIIDCNDLNKSTFLTFVNENIPIILPYINNNILIDCNNAINTKNFVDMK